MAKRQVGKCEAIYRAIPSMQLQGSNIACTFVLSGYPENQSEFLRKVTKSSNQSSNISDTESTHSSNNGCYEENDDNFENNEDDDTINQVEDEGNNGMNLISIFCSF